MTERPIIFSGPMVRAILEGRKTQTRRIVKGLPEGIKFVSLILESGYQYRFTDFNGTNVDLRCPYGRPALPLEPPQDRLWVRETWCEDYDGRETVYKADDVESPGPTGFWRPSIFMPRNRSRLTLGVVNIRSERLQAINEKDAKAEGISVMPPSDGLKSSLRAWFAHRWNEINGKRGYSWESNPWVWVIEFRRPQETNGHNVQPT